MNIRPDMIFFVTARIQVDRYMVDNVINIDHNSIVIADDIDQAEEKYKKYWSDQNSEYSVMYMVVELNIEPAIF